MISSISFFSGLGASKVIRPFAWACATDEMLSATAKTVIHEIARFMAPPSTIEIRNISWPILYTRSPPYVRRSSSPTNLPLTNCPFQEYRTHITAVTEVSRKWASSLDRSIHDAPFVIADENVSWRFSIGVVQAVFWFP